MENPRNVNGGSAKEPAKRVGEYRTRNGETYVGSRFLEAVNDEARAKALKEPVRFRTGDGETYVGSEFLEAANETERRKTVQPVRERRGTFGQPLKPAPQVEKPTEAPKPKNENRRGTFGQIIGGKNSIVAESRLTEENANNIEVEANSKQLEKPLVPKR